VDVGLFRASGVENLIHGALVAPTAPAADAPRYAKLT
jgi:hypothetical protein